MDFETTFAPIFPVQSDDVSNGSLFNGEQPVCKLIVCEVPAPNRAFVSRTLTTTLFELELELPSRPRPNDDDDDDNDTPSVPNPIVTVAAIANFGVKYFLKEVSSFFLFNKVVDSMLLLSVVADFWREESNVSIFLKLRV